MNGVRVPESKESQSPRTEGVSKALGPESLCEGMYHYCYYHHHHYHYYYDVFFMIRHLGLINPLS